MVACNGITGVFVFYFYVLGLSPGSSRESDILVRELVHIGVLFNWAVTGTLNTLHFVVCNCNVLFV